MSNSKLGYDLDPNIKVCTKCIYDERVPGISFDDLGVCNYCKQTESLAEQYQTGQPQGKADFQRTIDAIKFRGRGKKYDCVIGVSGGTDSSFLIDQAVRVWGLRPLAVHYDNTWNSAIATQNISRVLQPLNIDLVTHVVANQEVDDVFGSFFRAGVPELDASTDLALVEVLYRAAWRFGVRYVLEGHSFLTEGITPVGKNYFDGKYIDSIHKRFGAIQRKTYPLMNFNRFLFWSSIARIERVRPFWYLDYSKESARALLEERYGWTYYGGHHLENRLTAFAHSVYLPQKFNSDLRNNTLSALVRNGKISREDAWDRYNEPPHIEDELVAYFQKRLGLSANEYASIMAEAPKSWREFPTYKKRFERLRPLFKVLADTNLVPRSFYLKYCFPVQD